MNWLTANWDELLVLVAIVLGVAVGGGIALWVIARGPLARINKETATVVGQFAAALSQSQAALETTANTLRQALTRETELTRGMIEMQNALDAVNDRMKKAERENQESCDRLTSEITRLLALTKRQDNDLVELQRAGERKDAQMEQLRTRVQVLERQVIDRDRKIADLEIALDRSEQDKRELVDELRRLEGRLNAKADKAVAVVADSTEAAPVAQEQVPSGESGEHTPPADGKEESVDISAKDAGEQKDHDQ